MKKIILIMLPVLLLLLASSVLAQDKTKEPATDKPAVAGSIIKPFPPELSNKFDDAQKELEYAKSQLNAAQASFAAAQANLRLLIYQVADAVELTKKEKDVCPYSRTANGTWIFTCPAETATAVKPKEPAKQPQ